MLLIHTKLSIPTLRRTQISRLQLVQQLNIVLEPGVKLGLLASPPGFGKTSLLAEWAAQHPGQVAWLSLDGGDNEPIRFWDYCIAALQQVRPGLGERLLPLLHEPTPLPLQTILGMLLNEIVQEPGPLLLVLDDYHAIQTEAIHHDLSFLLEHLPVQMRLVIATRVEPPLPLARLRVQGEMVEMRITDLRFSTDETTAFLTRIPDLHLRADEVAALAKRTEGWAAGLQIAALALHGRTDVSQFVQSFTGDHRFVLDYLVDEVLGRQPAAVQQFLLQTSILARLNAPLCAWLTGQEEAQAQLEALERDNLFVVALDDKREWYRYHQLFADCLRHQLQQQTPEQVSGLHRRAATWFARQGLMLEAVAHALAAQDYDQAADLIEQVAELLLWRRPELHTLHGWLAALPETVLAARPHLGLYHAWVLYLTNRMPAAEQRVQATAQALASGDHADNQLASGMLAAVRSSLTGIRRQFGPAIEQARQALAQLPEGAMSWRCMAAINLGVACAATGSVAEATDMLAYAMELSQEIGSSFAMLSAFWHLASLQVTQLQLDAADATCRRLLQLVQDPNLAPFAADGYIALLRGEICLERNELEAAEQYLLASAEQINPEGFPMALLRSYVALTRLRALQGDGVGEQHYLSLAEGLVHSHQLQSRATPLALHRAAAWLAEEKFALLDRWIVEQGIGSDDAIVPYQEPVYLMLVRYLMLKARVEADADALHQAQTLARRMIDQAETTARPGSQLRALVVYALALTQDGDQEAALACLDRALALAEPERCVRVFADHGGVMVRLLTQFIDAQRQGKLSTPPSAGVYLQTLLTACGVGHSTEPVHAVLPVQQAQVMMIEPLSNRELEVLHLLVEGLSSNEIAERLVIAVETARKHIKNIYGKLDAHNRIEAVKRSQELGLL